MEGDDGRIDSFDDLFEPFELEEPPPPGSEPPRPEPEGYVACPSCGTRNKPHNRHCEACGARIAQGPLPVAPQPMLRTTPGARALGILTAVVLVVALLALIVNVWRGGDDSTDPTVANGGTGAPGGTATSLATPQLPIEQLTPTNVIASSELEAFPADNLIDGDQTTRWNDASLQGDGAELQFLFAQPVQINQIVFYNVSDPAGFARNYRIRNLQIETDDINQVIIRELENTSDPQPIDIGTLETRSLVMKVTDVFPAETFENQPPFDELALQEIEFFGKVVG